MLRTADAVEESVSIRTATAPARQSLPLAPAGR